MRSLDFAGNTGSSRIMLGAAFDQLNKFCDTEKTAIIVDRDVLELHRDKLSSYQRLIEIEPGEQQKTLETVNTIYERFLEWELDRSSTIVGVGGGMVCDMSGFAASTYLRDLVRGRLGIHHHQIAGDALPTTTGAAPG